MTNINRAATFSGVGSEWPWELKADGTFLRKQPAFLDISGEMTDAQIAAATAKTQVLASTISAAVIPASMSRLVTNGYAAAKDAGFGAPYIRAASGSGPGAVQDATGAWWQLDTAAQWLRPEWWGAKGDGTTDDTVAVKACIAASLGATKPCGVLLSAMYVVSAALLDGSYHENLVIKGTGQSRSGFINKLTGATLLNIGNTYWTRLSDFQIVGNNLTGASGNGHAISLVDPSYSSGSFLPGFAVIDRVFITYHRGNDVNGATGSSMRACGIHAVNALSCRVNDTVIEYCGYAAWVQATFQFTFDGIAIAGNDLAGIVDYSNERLVIENSNILDSDAGQNSITVNGTAQANASVVVASSWGTVIQRCKFKEFGSAAISVCSQFAPIIRDNWFALGTTPTGGVTKFAAIVSKWGVRVDANIFDTFGPSAATRYHIYLEPSNGYSDFGNISNNTFRWNGGGAIQACVYVTGSASNTNLSGVIEGNIFGTADATSNSATVAAAVKLDSMTPYMVKVVGNRVVAPTNVTITTAFDFSGVSSTSNFSVVYENNQAYAFGGTLTAELSAAPYPYRMAGRRADGLYLSCNSQSAPLTNILLTTLTLGVNKSLSTSPTYLGTVTFTGRVTNSKSAILATSNSPISGMNVYGTWSGSSAQQVDLYATLQSGTATLNSGSVISCFVIAIGD